MSKRDYYEILGIDRGSGASEIKSAYRKMAMKYHPDRNPGDHSAEDKFKEATEAYEILKDPQKRQMFDQYGHAGVNQGGGFGGGGFGGGAGFEGFDLSDALRAFMRDFGGGSGGAAGGSIFDEFFGGGGQRNRRNRGEDLRIRIKLTLEEVASGVKKKVKVKRMLGCDACGSSGVSAGSSKKTCPQCKGHGQVRTIQRTFLGTVQQVTTCDQCRGTGEIIADPCRVCHGEGRKSGTTEVTINVPAGITSGNYMSIENMGNAAPHNGESGDLVAVFEEAEHDFFTRHGDDLICEIPISFTMAALGGEIQIPTINGEETLKIPSGTQPGKTLKFKGEGVPHLHRNGKGDQLIRIHVWVPTKLNSEDKNLLRKLASSASFKAPKPGKSFFDKLKQTLGV